MDVQEIDGASNTSVDDIRTLRENVKYTPSSRYKIYIIDEVHMLSKSAFAALLKTLEEPPDHVRFIFATTDVEKIPATILSRVLRFDFRRPGTEMLVSHLGKIATIEKIQIEHDALLLIARQAEGSIRDSLSLLDRVISFAGKKITPDDVIKALGISGRDAVLRLLEHAIEKQTSEALQFVDSLYHEGYDIKQFCSAFMEAIRDVLLYKVMGNKGFVDLSQGERDAIRSLSEKSEMMDLEYLFHIFHRSYRDIVYSPLPRVLLEIVVLRLCTRADRESIGQLIEKLEGFQKETPSAVSPPALKQHPVIKQNPNTAQENRIMPKTVNRPDTWKGFLSFAGSKKPSLVPILNRVRLLGETDQQIELGYPEQATYKNLLEEPKRQELVLGLVQEYFKKQAVFRNGNEPAKHLDSEKNCSSIIEEAISLFKPKRTEVTGRQT